MERIQFAIAKARAERAARGEAPLPQDLADAAGEAALAPAPGLPEAGVLVPPHTPPAPIEAPAQNNAGEAPDPADVALAWRDLPTLRVNEKHTRRSLIVSLGGGSGAAEIDGIRTRLLQHLKAKGIRRVAITSPGPGCGKSTVALNLGFSLGRQPDQRTILADVDLRRPHMGKAMGVKERHSFAEVLSGEASFAQNALRHGQNLALATTHAPARNPAELLQSRKAGETIAAISAAYDPTVMIFDLPPLLVNDDAIAFLGHVDCALIVAAAEKTTIKEIDRCERELAAQTSVLGVILNRCRYMDSTDGYTSYYG